MKRNLLLLCLFATQLLFAQTDTTKNKAMPSAFEHIMKEVSTYKPDTTAPPNDKITQRIIELRNLRGGFNINEAIAFKLDEDLQKGEIATESHQKSKAFFTTGNGKRWLDNAVIWIYRARFTDSELKGLVKFYKTSAGQKMAADLPVIMVESAAAGEMIKSLFEKEEKKSF